MPVPPARSPRVTTPAPDDQSTSFKDVKQLGLLIGVVSAVGIWRYGQWIRTLKSES